MEISALQRNFGEIVYWSTFIECTKCQEWSTSSTQCNNEKCSGRDKNGNPYKFKKADKKNTRRGVMPYKIKFDLTSNLVFVIDGIRYPSENGITLPDYSEGGVNEES